MRRILISETRRCPLPVAIFIEPSPFLAPALLYLSSGMALPDSTEPPREGWQGTTAQVGVDAVPHRPDPGHSLRIQGPVGRCPEGVT